MRALAIAAVTGAGLTLAGSIALAAGAPLSTDGTDPAGWDRTRDGILVAPENHREIYESDTIRVGSVHVWNHAAEPFHLHPYYSVLVIDLPYGDPPGSGMDRDVDLKPAPNTMIDNITAPIVNIQPPQALHSIQNTGPIDGHLTRVEFKTAARPTKVERAWGAGPMPVSTDGSDPKSWSLKEDSWNAAPKQNVILWRDDNVRVISMTVAPGEVTPSHINPYPSVLVIDKAAAHTVATKGKAPVMIPASGPRVLLQPPEAPHTFRNTDDTAFHMIRIEYLKGFPTPPGS